MPTALSPNAARNADRVVRKHRTGSDDAIARRKAVHRFEVVRTIAAVETMMLLKVRAWYLAPRHARKKDMRRGQPRSTSKNAAPYRSSFASPTPGT